MRCLRELESVERGKEQGESRNGGPCRQVRRAPPNEALHRTGAARPVLARHEGVAGGPGSFAGAFGGHCIMAVKNRVGRTDTLYWPVGLINHPFLPLIAIVALV
jgi:hypothetical protein